MRSEQIPTIDFTFFLIFCPLKWAFTRRERKGVKKTYGFPLTFPFKENLRFSFDLSLFIIPVNI